jgi:hypothetical protein
MTAYELPQMMQPPAQAISAPFFANGANEPPPVATMPFAEIKTISGARFLIFLKRPGTDTSPLDCDGFSKARERSTEETKALAAKWMSLMLDKSAPVNANALTKTVKPLFEALSRYGAGAVDLRGLRAEQVNGVHLAVVLRATFSRKQQTLGWEHALSVARDALRRDGLEDDDALAGLS